MTVIADNHRDDGWYWVLYDSVLGSKLEIARWDNERKSWFSAGYDGEFHDGEFTVLDKNPILPPEHLR